MTKVEAFKRLKERGLEEHAPALLAVKDRREGLWRCIWCGGVIWPPTHWNPCRCELSDLERRVLEQHIT